MHTTVFALGLCNLIFTHGKIGENKSGSSGRMFGQNWTTILCSDWLLKKWVNIEMPYHNKWSHNSQCEFHMADSKWNDCADIYVSKTGKRTVSNFPANLAILSRADLIHFVKGQLNSECLLGVIDFPWNQRKIWQISALESKKWSNQQSKSTFL